MFQFLEINLAIEGPIRAEAVVCYTCPITDITRHYVLETAIERPWAFLRASCGLLTGLPGFLSATEIKARKEGKKQIS